MSSEQRAKLLHFATGSSRLPPTGFEALDGTRHPKFKVYVDSGVPCDQLPTAHTCNNLLRIASYPDEATLRAKLLSAVDELGFGFV